MSAFGGILWSLSAVTLSSDEIKATANYLGFNNSSVTSLSNTHSRWLGVPLRWLIELLQKNIVQTSFISVILI